MGTDFEQGAITKPYRLAKPLTMAGVRPSRKNAVD